MLEVRESSFWSPKKNETNEFRQKTNKTLVDKITFLDWINGLKVTYDELSFF